MMSGMGISESCLRHWVSIADVEEGAKENQFRRPGIHAKFRLGLKRPCTKECVARLMRIAGIGLAVVDAFSRRGRPGDRRTPSTTSSLSMRSRWPVRGVNLSPEVVHSNRGRRVQWAGARVDLVTGPGTALMTGSGRVLRAGSGPGVSEVAGSDANLLGWLTGRLPRTAVSGAEHVSIGPLR